MPPSILSPGEGLSIGCFQFFAITNSAEMNIEVCSCPNWNF